MGRPAPSKYSGGGETFASADWALCRCAEPPSGNAQDVAARQLEAPFSTEPGEQHLATLVRFHTVVDRELALEHAADEAHLVAAPKLRT